jgi:hypothetical protein
MFIIAANVSTKIRQVKCPSRFPYGERIRGVQAEDQTPGFPPIETYVRALTSANREVPDTGGAARKRSPET